MASVLCRVESFTTPLYYRLEYFPRLMFQVNCNIYYANDSGEKLWANLAAKDRSCKGCQSPALPDSDFNPYFCF